MECFHCKGRMIKSNAPFSADRNGYLKMEYKGYIGVVEYDDYAKLFHGDVINIKTVITFQGKSVDEIEQAFRDSIDDYIAWCEEGGVAPEKPYSGKFNLQLSPSLHREVAVMAKKLKVSVDSFVEKALIDV